VGAIGPPPLWLTAKTSTRRPARSPPSRSWNSGSRSSPATASLFSDRLHASAAPDFSKYVTSERSR
jgi:hypothetical protein